MSSRKNIATPCATMQPRQALAFGDHKTSLTIYRYTLLPLSYSCVSLSRGIMGGDVWMPDLYQKSSRMRRIALWMLRKRVMMISAVALSIVRSRVLRKESYFAIWIRTTTSQRPGSFHSLAAPISVKTSTYSRTESQVSSLCWERDYHRRHTHTQIMVSCFCAGRKRWYRVFSNATINSI